MKHSSTSLCYPCVFLPKDYYADRNGDFVYVHHTLKDTHHHYGFVHWYIYISLAPFFLFVCYSFLCSVPHNLFGVFSIRVYVCLYILYIYIHVSNEKSTASSGDWAKNLNHGYFHIHLYRVDLYVCNREQPTDEQIKNEWTNEFVHIFNVVWLLLLLFFCCFFNRSLYSSKCP